MYPTPQVVILAAAVPAVSILLDVKSQATITPALITGSDQ
jgi:hypothetical protein